MAEEISLDAANAKQKVKIYKAVVKEVKSKEIEIKLGALLKFKDCRYLTEGGSMTPFVESITIKKKSIDYSKTALDSLVSFVEAADPAAGGADSVLAAIKSVVDRENGGDLLPLRSVVDALVFKEEIKKVKVKSPVKGQPAVVPDDPPEREVVLAIRSLAIRALKGLINIFTNPLVGAGLEGRESVMPLLAAVPGIDRNIVWVLDSLVGRYDNDKTNETILQEGCWTLMCACAIFKYSDSNVSAALPLGLVSSLSVLTTEKCFAPYCAQLFETLSMHQEGIATLSDPLVVAELVRAFDICAEELHVANSATAAAAGAGGKKAPPPDKGKKGAKDAGPQPGENKFITADVNRLMVVAVRGFSVALAQIARHPEEYGACFSEDIVTTISNCMGKIIPNPLVWQLSKSPLAEPFNAPVDDVIDSVAIAIADIACVSSSVRSLICNTGVVFHVLTAFQSSSVVVGADVSDAGVDVQQKLIKLRRILERSVLCLLTEPCHNVRESDGSTSNRLRWASCSSFITDISQFPSAPIPVVEAPVGKGAKAAPKEPEVSSTSRGPMPFILSLALSDDALQGNHGFRLLYALVQGVDDVKSFAVNNSLDAAVVTKLTVAIQLRIQNVITEIAEKRAVVAIEVGGSEVEVDGSDAAAAIAFDVAIDPILVAQALPPSHSATLYCGLGVLETLVALSSDAVNAFATKETVALAAKLLYCCGPVSVGINEIGNVPEEFEAVLLDLRRFFWIPRDGERVNDPVMLRPLLMDLLSTVAVAHSKYGTFESAAPAGTCQPLPACTSPCREASMLVSKLCGDSCCSILLTKSVFSFNNEGNIVALPNKQSAVLHVSVVDSVLGLVQSMASTGADSIYGILESVAEAGLTASRHPNAALSALQSFLIASEVTDPPLQPPEDVPVEDSGVDSLRIDGKSPLKSQPASVLSDFVWSRPQFFDQLVTQSTISSIKLNKGIWPYVALCASILGTLASPDVNFQTASLAIQSMKTMCSSNLFADNSQPVCYDCLSAVYLSLGAAVTAIASLGRFGTLKDNASPDDYEGMLQFVRFLVQRGRCRETFWADWAKAQAEKVEIDPKTGKPVAKPKDKGKEKDKKAADKKKGGKDVPIVSCVAEAVYNDEPDETNPDPNHGPTQALWKYLINVRCDDFHGHCPLSTPLTCAVQCSLVSIVDDLIHEGVDVNAADARNTVALMYAVLLGDEDTAQAIVHAGADLDKIDIYGNPLIKYATITLSEDDVNGVLLGHLPDAQVATAENISAGTHNSNFLLGKPTAMLELLLSHGIDVRVSDADGNSPLLCIVGLARATFVVGGYQLVVANSAYDTTTSRYPEAPLPVVEMLIKAGADVNFCNVNGVVPLHVAAGRGDISLINCLVAADCLRNPADSLGFLPVHYTAAACPKFADEVLTLLLENCKGRPVVRMEFKDDRTGKSSEEKYGMDIDAISSQVFAETLSPSSLRQSRLTAEELLLVKTDVQTNIVQLSMCAHSLPFDNIASYVVGRKEERMLLSMNLILLLQNKLEEVFCNIDLNGMNILHAASRMFTGLTPKRELTAAELRSKRYKAYPSMELQILDLIFQNLSNLDVNAVCNWPAPWTALHSAVKYDNSDLIATLLEKGARPSLVPHIVHFLACHADTSQETAELIINTCSSLPEYNVLLNSPGHAVDGDTAARPLHIAVRYGSAATLAALLQCPKCDVNARDEETGMTALHEACHEEFIDVLKVFTSYSDRLDLLVKSSVDGSTCVDAALDECNAAILRELIEMRRNDVVECVVSVGPHGRSRLEQIERLNMQYAMRSGLVDPDAAVGQSLSAQLESMSINEQPEEVAVTTSASGDFPVMLQSEGEGDGDELGIIPTNTTHSPHHYLELETGEAQFSPSRPMSPGSNINEMLQNEIMVKMLIRAVNDTGFGLAGAHAHPCFAEGQTFADYCRSKSNE